MTFVFQENNHMSIQTMQVITHKGWDIMYSIWVFYHYGACNEAHYWMIL